MCLSFPLENASIAWLAGVFLPLFLFQIYIWSEMRSKRGTWIATERVMKKVVWRLNSTKMQFTVTRKNCSWPQIEVNDCGQDRPYERVHRGRIMVCLFPWSSCYRNNHSSVMDTTKIINWLETLGLSPLITTERQVKLSPMWFGRHKSIEWKVNVENLFISQPFIIHIQLIPEWRNSMLLRYNIIITELRGFK